MPKEQILWDTLSDRDKLRYLLLRRLEQAHAHMNIEKELGGAHLACYRAQEALIREIAEEMGISLP